MNLFLTNHWLLFINSIAFWLAPVALAINLAIGKNKPNSYKKKIGYFYGSLWAIAFLVYFAIFIFKE
ncbi:conserved hypothetical protein [Hyella patelloides LEGE 07179]|uniref:Uncharacterized protein n=1 Tax=Hyella patelloides LEGE 07179 TaxID=945734 RepID=A0A563VKJ3_9CYAN|nr:hypothetical protein [Hyella patelloides]VEP11986.1 conserved hypothetical protein [Hyella patelloides LEGE 07179]